MKVVEGDVVISAVDVVVVVVVVLEDAVDVAEVINTVDACVISVGRSIFYNTF